MMVTRKEKDLVTRLRVVALFQSAVGRPAGIIVSKHRRHEYLAATRLIEKGQALILWQSDDVLELTPGEKLKQLPSVLDHAGSN
jgi:hypothetical protein